MGVHQVRSEFDADVQDIDLLNEAGKTGWELVTIEVGIAYLKRPVRSAGSARTTRLKSEGNDA
jgi:hypothetical protein